MDRDSERLEEWCPLHHLEDDCYEKALERKWNDLKVRHTENCDRTDCKIDEKYKSIVHGNSGVHATTMFWWRGMCYI